MDEAALTRIVSAIAKTVLEFDPGAISEPVTIEAFRQAFDQKLSAADRALMDMVRMDAADAAIDRHSGAYVQALHEADIPSGAVTLLLSWVTIQLQARALLHQAVTQALVDLASQPQAPRTNAAGSPRTLLTITAKRQVALNEEVLRHLGVAPGAQVEISLLSEARVELRAASGGSIEDFVGVLAGKTDRRASIDELIEAVGRGRR